MFEVRQGDCVKLMAAMPAGSVDAVVCDPPYGLEFMGKDWDRLGAAVEATRTSAGGGTPEGRTEGLPNGFAGARVRFGATARQMQEWHQAWATEALRVLKPGGHLLAFGGTRTYHRLVCAVEDAGFEIRDTIAYMYGSGFPKSLNVSKAIDKAAGAEREVVGMGAAACEHIARGEPCPGHGDENGRYGETVHAPATASATPEAERWEGWGTALKPAHEPVVVARKPLSGTVASNCLEHGVGALNVDGCRVEGEPVEIGMSLAHRGGKYGAGDGGRGTSETRIETSGRWPANVVLSHTEGCVQVGTRKVKSSNAPANQEESTTNTYGWAKGGIYKSGQRHGDPDGTETVGAWSCTPDCPVRLLDEQTGETSSPNGPVRQGGHHRHDVGLEGDTREGFGIGYGDTGGASRFFPTFTQGKLCVLCSLPCVESAANPSPRSEPVTATAVDDVRAPLSLEREDSSPSGDTGASTAEPSLRSMPATPTAEAVDDSVPLDAQQKLGEWIAQLAGSAEPLCKSCETFTAQSVALWLTDPTQASQVGQGSTLERRRLTLSRNLALIAAGSKQSGITPTTAVLSTSFGSADLATGSDTAAPATATNRFAYHPKSSRGERNAGLEGFEEKPRRGDAKNSTPRSEQIYEAKGALGGPRANHHPTVKPISLMRWLVRLVTPPGGTVLDPFCGSGTTGCACALEAFDFVGLERETEYVKIAEARIAWWHKHRGDGEAAQILAAGELRDEVEATGQLGMFD